jgi:hypothetical protein
MLGDDDVHAPRAKIVERIALNADGPPGSIRTAAGRELHRAMSAELEARGDLDDVARVLVTRVVRNVEEADNARETAAAEPLVVGSTGQLVGHPSWKIAQALEARVLADVTALGLTPQAHAARGRGGAAGGDGDGGSDDPLARLDQLAARRADKRKRGAAS